MELDWSTFVLEVINFVVLVWILQRFLYRPVLDVIDRRRRSVEDQLDEARRLNDEARQLKDRYGSRLQSWETERRSAQDALADELDAERSRRLTELQTLISQERDKARVADEREAAARDRASELQALRQAAKFSSRILSQASGPELEARLVELMLEELDQLPKTQIASLREQWGEPPAAIRVSSAFDLKDDQRRDIEARLGRLSGLSVPVEFATDPRLVAGVLIELGSWVLAANVRDELRGFAELANAGD